MKTFTFASLRKSTRRRRQQVEFIARGLSASEEARQSGLYYPAAAVHAELQQKMDAKRKQLRG